jgi:MraZ protein
MSPSLLFLTGEYNHRLDSKNRLFIPGRLRGCIYPDRDGLGFFLVFGPNKILGLYPDRYYRRLALSGAGQLVPGAGLVDFERITFALASHLELDPQSRLTLPTAMLKRAHLGREVVLIGVKDHIELWDAKVWKIYLATQLSQHEELLELGRGARSGQSSQEATRQR